jgi:hypothetical protein
MKSVRLKSAGKICGAIVFSVLFFLSSTEFAQAQFVGKWLNAGSYHHFYSSGGARPEQGSGMIWPAIQRQPDHFRSQAMWISAENWSGDISDPDKVYDVKVVHRGPREEGFGQFFGQRLDVLHKFDPPKVFVDGLESFQRPVFDDGDTPAGVTAERMVVTDVSTALGVSFTRRAYQFSNEYHDNYHILEYVFRNDGNLDENPETIENDGVDLEDVYITWLNRYKPNGQASSIPWGSGWGRTTMNDVVGDGYYEYGVDFRALYSWLGKDPNWADWDNMGGPAIRPYGWRLLEPDSVGRLTAADMIGRLTLFASESPASFNTNSNDQPSTTTFLDSDDEKTTAASMFDESQMNLEYELITEGHLRPYHNEITVPDFDDAFAENADVPPQAWRDLHADQSRRPDFITVGGIQSVHAYGPYDIAFGDSVKIILAEGVNGLGREATFEVGAAYKSAWETADDNDDYADIPFDANGDGTFQDDVPVTSMPGTQSTELIYRSDFLGNVVYDEVMNKNEWAMTARDSLFETFRRATANYNSDFTIPEPPYPPAEFRISSDAERVNLSWLPPQTGGPNVTGYEVYRARESLDSTFVKIATVTHDGSPEYEIQDEDAVRGIEHYYYIQSVGEEVTDNVTWGAAHSRQVTLRSNRYFTQSFAPAQLKKAPGTALEDTRIVPNPFNLAAEQGIRWPDRQDKMGFLNIPGQCTIKIYTEAGELIKTLVHTDGSGDEYWNMTTESTQLVVSGIYFAVIIDDITGDKIIRKFTVIR